MLGIRTRIIVVLLSLVANGAGTAACGTGAQQQESAQQNRQSNNTQVKPQGIPQTEKDNVHSDLKILGQGAHNLVSEAFVAVARDAKTYQELRRLDDNLPILSADAFNGMAVVAAF